MTEALVSTLIETLKTIIVDGVVAEARLLRGVKGEVRKLKTNLEAVHALLEDAEEKQISDKGIKLWLDRLKEAALDMEDALDEWRTRVLMQRQSDDSAENASFLRRKVRKFLQCFSLDHGFVRQHRVAGNIKELNEKLDEIVKERDRYQLTAASSSSQIKKQSRRKESTSLVDESRVVGRDGVKKEIISYLLCSGSRSSRQKGVFFRSPIQTISIVGMGGLGKTTLAQVVYNDPDVRKHFPDRIWACVSEVFDEIQVAKAIIVGIEGLGKEGTLQLQPVPLDALLKRVCECIHGKKFLLVLDDVWTEREYDFEALKISFKHGAKGSRILVTTRKENVAKVMDSQHTIHLQTLNQELCMSILMKKALQGRTNCEDLEQVGWKIAEKCKGLPLVVQALGGLLQSKTTRREWEHVLNNEMWKLDIINKNVFIPLLLSYYDLPPPVRQCFMYCALFAKDTSIYTARLIAYWMAQGYLGCEDDSVSSELKGQEYCKILLARSFFQEFAFDLGGYPFLKMHDLVHDFAFFLCNEEFVEDEVFKARDTDGNSKIHLPDKTRHLSLMIEKEAHIPLSISGAENLRSIVVCGQKITMTSQAFRNLFIQAKRLRVLVMPRLMLEDYTTIPEEVGKLLHLRYLNLFLCESLSQLPKEFCKLFNLQFLILSSTGIEKLPDEIGNLVNLKVLQTTSCNSLTSYPKGVSKLTRLTQLLGLVVITDYDHPQKFSLGDLENLERLTVLRMILVGKTINKDEAKKVNLQNLQGLAICVDEDMVEDDSMFECLNMSKVPVRIFSDKYFNIGFEEIKEFDFCYFG